MYPIQKFMQASTGSISLQLWNHDTGLISAPAPNIECDHFIFLYPFIFQLNWKCFVAGIELCTAPNKTKTQVRKRATENIWVNIIGM